MLLLQQMVVLFALMLIGFYIRRKEYISDETCRHLSWMVVNIANPALVVSGSLNSEETLRGQAFLETIVLVAAVYALLFLVSILLPYICRVPGRNVGVYRVMMIFSNIGFMGFPLINAVYGSDALLRASLFLIPYNLLIYTYGIAALKPKEEQAPSGESTRKFRGIMKKVLNIGVLGCIVAMVISFTGWKAPDFVRTTVTNLSNLTAPLSMLVIGASMVQINLKELFTDARLLVFSALKLLVVPLIGLFLLKPFVADPTMLGVCLVMLSTPVGSMTAMMAQQYGGDYEMASKGVALTTILSVATIPLVSMLTGI